MGVESKPIWKSKTGWVGMILAAILEFHPDLNQWVSHHPDTIILLYTAAMVLLRRISSGAVHFFRAKQPQSELNKHFEGNQSCSGVTN